MATSMIAWPEPSVLYAQERTERINFVAALPLLATKTLPSKVQSAEACASGLLYHIIYRRLPSDL